MGFCKATITATVLSLTLLATTSTVSAVESSSDAEFERLGERYTQQFAAFSPVRATGLGDHRFDGQLDDISTAAREKRLSWMRDLGKQLGRIDKDQLSRENQVDYALLKHALTRGSGGSTCCGNGNGIP